MKSRKIFQTLVKELENNKILLLVWPRQVGKTTLLEQLQSKIANKKTFFISMEEVKYKKALDDDPENIFWLWLTEKDQDQVIFIDEIQYLTDPSNFLKHIYDKYHKNVKLVVSGSSSFYIDQKFKDSLMWRKELYELLTLDFSEFLDFKDENNLKDYIFSHQKVPVWHENRVRELFLEYITYGGYPEVVLFRDIADKVKKLQSLSNDYIKKDIYDSNIGESDNFLSLLSILANQTGELVNINELSKTLSMSNETIKRYLYVMRKSYSIGLSKPFWTNIRAELTKMPKVFFLDLWLRNSFLKNYENINHRLDKWQFFENVVWREMILKYGIDNVQYWKNQHQNEVDFIINKTQAYEAKFSPHQIQSSKYKVFKQGYPSFNLDFITFDNVIEEVILRN